MMEVDIEPIARKHTITMTELDENCVKKVKKEHLTMVQEEALSKKKAQIKKKKDTGIKKTVSSVSKTLNSSAKKPTPLILDGEGRQIDIIGKKDQLTKAIHTLKGTGIGTETRNEFKKTFMDFIQFSSDIKIPDELQDMKVLLEEIESKMSKMQPDFSSIQKMVLLMPKEQLTKYCPPWASSYLNEAGEVQFEKSNTSHLVEHPLQISPPTLADPLKPVAMPESSTEKERNDLLKEIWRTQFDKVCQIYEIDKSKFGTSDPMRVLGYSNSRSN